MYILLSIADIDKAHLEYHNGHGAHTATKKQKLVQYKIWNLWRVACSSYSENGAFWKMLKFLLNFCYQYSSSCQ